jgi:hypothetical protein
MDTTTTATIIALIALTASVIWLTIAVMWLEYKCIQMSYKIGEYEQQRKESGIPLELKISREESKILKAHIERIINGDDFLVDHYKTMYENRKRNEKNMESILNRKHNS